ncbi:hypothetical protein PMIN06_000335 [Paraphaeosphaeria minitans]
MRRRPEKSFSSHQSHHHKHLSLKFAWPLTTNRIPCSDFGFLQGHGSAKSRGVRTWLRFLEASPPCYSCAFACGNFYDVQSPSQPWAPVCFLHTDLMPNNSSEESSS